MIVLGVDPATTRIALGDDVGRAVSVEIPLRLEGSERMARIHSETQRLVHDFLDGQVCPTICFVEQPAGHVHPSLWQAFGVIQAATWITLSTVERFPVSVFSIVPTEWKRIVLDNGQADKSAIMEWARANGYEGKVQDEADACGIARAGYRLLRSRPGA